MHRPLFALSVFGLIACASFARAQDQGVTIATRELAKQAFQAYDEGRYEEAAEKSLKAYQVARVPTIAVVRARALVKLGKLVDASELYLEASRIARDPAWQAVQDEAQRNAERERAELMPRIPRLKIAIAGADPAKVVVSVDNRKIPLALLDTEQVVDPGDRTVVGTFGQQQAREIVSPKEGEQLTVTLTFEAVAAAPATGAIAGETAARQTVYVEPKKPIGTVKSLGWTGVGLGGAGLVFGLIEGLSAKSKRTSLYETNHCSPDGTQCISALSGDVDSYNLARNLSVAGFVAGGILAAAGATLLVLPSKKESQPSLALLVGPSFIGVRGEML